MENLKKFFNSPWSIRVIGGIILIIFGMIVNYYFNIHKMGIFQKILSMFLNLIKNIFLFKVPIWVICIIIIVLMVLVLIIVKLSDEYYYPYKYYKQDYFKGYKWGWSYFENSRDIQFLTLICEKCDIIMQRNSFYQYECPRCDKVIEENINDSKIEILIQDKIDKKGLNKLKKKEKTRR